MQLINNALLSRLVFIFIGCFCLGCESGKTNVGKATNEGWKNNPEYRAMFRVSVDDGIKRELSGVMPGGKMDWNEYWRVRMKAVHSHPDGEECADYIITRRREAGLPELK